MPRDPRLVNALLNVPSNWLTELGELRIRVEELEVGSAPLPEEITRGRLSIADLIISPAQGIEIANPVNANFTGAFMAGQGIEFDSVRYVLGNVINGELKTGFTELGTLFATEALIAGTITADAGLIGGWEITATTIESLTGGIGISLDSSGPVIQVGDTGGTYIVIDGANEWIRSSNFAAGASGFNIDASTGDAEFNNLVARGMIRTAVFQKDVVSSVGGSLLVLDSDVLDADMTAADNSTLTIQGNTAFSAGDILRMKDGSTDEWLEVVSGSGTYVVTRDKAGAYSANNNPAWKKGQAVVNYGQATEGGILLQGGSTPELTVFTHRGDPWNALVEHVSINDNKLSAALGLVTINHNGIIDESSLNLVSSKSGQGYVVLGNVYQCLPGFYDGMMAGLHFMAPIGSARFEDDFDDGTLNAWSTTGSPTVITEGIEGIYCARLSGADTIAKTLSATVYGGDQFYHVTCLYRRGTNGGGLVLTHGGATINGIGSSSSIHGLSSLLADQWYRAHFVFQANNDTTPTITFSNFASTGTVDIDSVEVFELQGTPTGFGTSVLQPQILGGLDVFGDVYKNGALIVTGETNANDIFRCDSPGGVSAFAGTIATLPGGATLTYNVSSGQEGAMVPTSTSQLAKMRLYNTTRGTSALISNCVVGTNTLTLTANVPAGWQVGDTITIASQTVSGGGFSWVDLEITSGPTNKSFLFVSMRISSGTVGDVLSIHPFESYAASKRVVINNLATTGGTFGWPLIKVTDNVFSIQWSGTPTNIIINETGYLA